MHPERCTFMSINCNPQLHFDFNVNACWQVEFHQCVNCLIRWINDVHQTLVRTNLELVTRRFVHVR